MQYKLTLLTILLSLLFNACGINSSTKLDDSNNTSGPLKIIGKIEYERVHVSHHGDSSKLDYNNITTESSKQILVQAVNRSGKIIASTTTDDNGSYALTNLPENTALKIRASAKMLKANKWNTKVVDNTNGSALYVLEGSLVSTGTQSTRRNLKALASTKKSPPFAILDSIYLAMKKVLTADSSVVFPPLKLNWTVNNVESGTYFDGVDNIMIQGDQKGDSDEYDDHIMIHEWGHYFEAKFSRADSIGGRHTTGDHLDIRLAFGEGWGNAWSAIATDDPIYFDTMGSNGWNMNIETATHETPGWFSEASIQRILYDLYDSNDDGADTLSLGFKPIYDVLVGSQKRTTAFTSIFSFISGLKSVKSSNSEAINSIVANENINEITDIYGTNRKNNVVSTALPLYKELIVDSGTTTNICLSTKYGVYNKLNNHKYIRFTVDSAGEKLISVITSSSSGNSIRDPDFLLYKVAPFSKVILSESARRDKEELSYTFKTGEYLLDIYDNSYGGDACFKVKVGN